MLRSSRRLGLPVAGLDVGWRFWQATLIFFNKAFKSLSIFIEHKSKGQSKLRLMCPALGSKSKAQCQ